jgi:DNA mismatch repair protein MutS
MALNEPLVDTPLMKQYMAVKHKYPDAVLLFRVGDFYETFSEDAIKASKILGITLTRRANGAATFVELAGFPFHALDTYLPKLVRAGERVAICEQLEDPKLTKKIVKRGVTELITPGVSINDQILEHKENNFLAAVHIERQAAGVSFMDISTGEFVTAEGSFEYVDKLLNNFSPKEVLFERGKEKLFESHFGYKFYTYKLDDWIFTADSAEERLLKQFETTSLKGFGIANMLNATISAGAILHYLDLTQHERTKHIQSISRIEEDKFVWLDKFTIRNLELFQSINEGGKTLIDVIDQTISPIGARMLKRWMALPLKEIQLLNERFNVVEYFLKHPDFREHIEDQIRHIGDLERLISKAAVARISPREVVQLRFALSAIEPVKLACESSDDATLRRIGEQLNPCRTIRDRIERELVVDAPNQVGKGRVIASGVLSDLDELRDMAFSGKDYLANLQERESQRTGITSLKVGFNNIFGYYFEVRNLHKEKVPTEWTRKQTLVGAERYINEELKEYETKILGAEERILEIETRLFNALVVALSDYITPVQLDARLIATLDVLRSFAAISISNRYIRPALTEENILEIHQGRHPVIEKQLPTGEMYIANDLYLDTTTQQIIIITGPNMAGKSALLRQTALIVLLAQIGCFVPAESATVGIVDKIFTRVGASDNLSLGESTFMVEMTEAASIINNLSPRSLILFDELGRGTSTYDGISIAWSIVEYIHEHPTARAKTLFATHYHELNEMEASFKRVKNFNVSVRELDNKVIFLRKLIRGGSEHSFGIHVARMAGMPKSIVARSNEILKELESSHRTELTREPVKELAQHREGFQLSFFQLDDPVLKQIRDEIAKLDINNLTPMEALNKLNDIKRITGLK